MPPPRILKPASSFLDARGDERSLRVSWHLEDGVDEGLAVLSLWRDNVCTGTFRLGVEDAADLVKVLSSGLGAALALSRTEAEEHSATG